MPRRHRSTSVSVVLTVALLAAIVLLHPSSQMQGVRRLVGLGQERVLAAPPIESLGGAYAFSATQPGSTAPVGWDPCTEVEYAVNPAGMPQGMRPLVERAVDRISAATGLAFEDAGPSRARSCGSAAGGRW